MVIMRYNQNIGLIFFALLLPIIGKSQVILHSYYDTDQQKVREEFTVDSKGNNILNGPYKSFYQEGGIKSEGQFVKNKSTGLWKYYYKNGNLRMQGNIADGKSSGQWEYYYENAHPKMKGKLVRGVKDGRWVFYNKKGTIEREGDYNFGKKTGVWKYYSAAGLLIATEDFFGEGSYYEEVYKSGGVKAEGKVLDGNKVGSWSYYYEDGTTKVQGDFVGGKRNGIWKFYDPSGKIKAEGRYDAGLANGIWIHYHNDGTVASKGNLVDDKKNGSWQMFYNDGTLKGEANYNQGNGEYKEYYKDGALKVHGMVKQGQHDGHWEYFYESGNLEGECDFVMGEGEYRGYYNDKNLKMKGKLKNDEKIGVWELYERSGELTGYYKPYYEEGESTFFIAEDVKEQKELSQQRKASAGSFRSTKKKSRYFRSKFHEYKALIVGYNPIAPLVGVFPLSAEYYMEERLGYELAMQYIRNPFFRSFTSVDAGETFAQGYAITFRQKFYHKETPMGQPYFGHELKYTDLYHSTNINNVATFGAHEQKLEYGVIIGSRYFKNVTSNGFTADAYVGFGIGYRLYNQSYVAPLPLTDPFSSLNSNNFAYSIRLGVNLGFAFRIKR